MSSSGRAYVAVVSALATLAAGSCQSVSAHQSRIAGERQPGLTVDFVAVQADGTPVADLHSSEVQVRINNRVRVVRSLRRVATAPAPAAPRAAIRVPSAYGTNDSVPAGRAFVLVVDEESFTAGRERLLRDAVEELLVQLTPADQNMVVALPYGGVKTPFTSDLARIRLAMKAVSAQGSRIETGSDLACRTRLFLESLEAFLQTQAGRASPLTVVLFTAGLAAPRRDAPMALAPGMCELPVTHFQRITVAAGAARANFYVVQPTDIAMSAKGWNETIGGVGHLGSDNPLEGIEHLAGATGAARLPLEATGAASLRRVASESSAFYEAELEPEPDEVFDRSRPLAVRVSRPGVMVRARPEITFARAQQRAGAARLTISALLGSRAAFGELPLRATGYTVRESNGRLRVGVVAEPVDPATPLDSVGAALVALDGRIVATWFASETMERPLLGAMVAPPGSYRLRVAAIDPAGRPGAAEDEVEVGLTAVGPFLLGSLMLGVSRDDGFTPRLEFGSEPTAIASFDIYDGVAGTRLSATLDVSRDPDGPALVTVPLALTRAGESRVVATGTVPLGALPPGEYVVRGVVRLEDSTMGRVMRTLKKVAR